MAHDILIVDDEADIRDADRAASSRTRATRRARRRDSAEALAAIRARQPTLVILDIWLQGSELDGIEILQIMLRAEMPPVPVVMISGHGTIETAVAAIKIGAYDFIEKPFKSDRLLLIVERAIEAARLRRENEELRLRAGGDDRPDRRLATPPTSCASRSTGSAPTGSRVLITGAARRRQGGGRAAACMPRSRRGQGAVRRGQLRDDAAGAARDRAVRHRGRRRRRAAQGRHLRAGAWRHAVPRRSRRHAARDPGQDRARAAGADVRARRRVEPGRGRCARRRLDQPRARRRDRRRPVPRGSVTIGSTSCRCRCRRCASGARTSRRSPRHFMARAAESGAAAAARIRRGRDGGAAGL